jgi:cobalt-zinc-cadmium efflux system membrane fusion protein
VVNKQAVQNINGDSIVFIKGSKGFRALDVKTGREDDHGIEIVSGLKAGQQYVAEGAFTLKSIMVTSGLDPHAGHGH